MQLVGNALVEAERLAAKAVVAQPARASAGAAAPWSIRTPEELGSAAKKAGRLLHVTAVAEKKWEAELISGEWRR